MTRCGDGSPAGWSHQKIAVVLFPFGAGAMAVNVFFASLIGSWIGASLVCDSFHFHGLCRPVSQPVILQRHIRE
jgi:hypothetical protein